MIQLIAFVTGVVLASAPDDLQARVVSLREQVRRNADMDGEERMLLEARLVEVQRTLAEYEKLAGQGAERKQRMDGLAMASMAIVANDATGVGAADNALLPLIGLAAVSTWLQTHPPARDAEMEAAWKRLMDALEATVKTAQAVLMAQNVGKTVRRLTEQIAMHLAELLQRPVSGYNPKKDPKNNRNHWWKEIRGFIQQLRRLEYTEKQFMRELQKQFTTQQIAEIREALQQAARMMEESFPGFPPLAL